MDWLALLGFGLACAGAASTGALFQPGEWYRRIAKPDWTPPDWLFPIAWTILYALIAYSGWRVSLTGDPAAAAGLGFWAAQLVFNATWSPVFFGLRRPGPALAILVAMWGSILLTIGTFAAVDLIAAILLVPYLVWVSFAGALNWWIWRNNSPEDFGATA
ncbi:MAG: TspO/MBR family protein [Pseudomonadota bacterium]